MLLPVILRARTRIVFRARARYIFSNEISYSSRQLSALPNANCSLRPRSYHLLPVNQSPLDLSRRLNDIHRSFREREAMLIPASAPKCQSTVPIYGLVNRLDNRSRVSTSCHFRLARFPPAAVSRRPPVSQSRVSSPNANRTTQSARV